MFTRVVIASSVSILLAPVCLAENAVHTGWLSTTIQGVHISVNASRATQSDSVTCPHSHKVGLVSTTIDGHRYCYEAIAVNANDMDCLAKQKKEMKILANWKGVHLPKSVTFDFYDLRSVNPTDPVLSKVSSMQFQCDAHSRCTVPVFRTQQYDGCRVVNAVALRRVLSAPTEAREALKAAEKADAARLAALVQEFNLAESKQTAEIRDAKNGRDIAGEKANNLGSCPGNTDSGSLPVEK